MELLTIKEIAKRLGISRKIVNNKICYIYKYGVGRVKNDKIRGVPYKGFCWEDVVAVIQAEAKKNVRQD